MVSNCTLQNDTPDEPMENPQEVLKECLEKFSTADYIMEPGIFTQLQRWEQWPKTIPLFLKYILQNLLRIFTILYNNIYYLQTTGISKLAVHPSK